MGYLDKSTITVDAVLTNRGRELLANSGIGATGFEITKFALADDEVDYRLYNTAHPLGTPSYGAIIENMPVLEATPDETQVMRYKLVTLTSNEQTKLSGTGALQIPRIFLNNAPSLVQGGKLTLNGTETGTPPAGAYFEIDPRSTAIEGTSVDDSYTVILADNTLANLLVISAGGASSTAVQSSNARRTSTARGTKFKIQSKPKLGTTTVTIFGDKSGAIFTFTLEVTLT